MEKAYSTIEVQKMQHDDEKMVIEGIASTPTPDRMGDEVMPRGAQFKLPIPLLLHHDHKQPVGHVVKAKATSEGITFEAEIPNVREEGTLKQRVDEAIHSLKYKLIPAVSIGFNADAENVELNDKGGFIFKVWEWLELSLVTIPAQPEARIALAKSIEHQRQAALGIKAADAEQQPRDRGTKRKPIQLIRRA